SPSRTSSRTVPGDRAGEMGEACSLHVWRAGGHERSRLRERVGISARHHPSPRPNLDVSAPDGVHGAADLRSKRGRTDVTKTTINAEPAEFAELSISSGYEVSALCVFCDFCVDRRVISGSTGRTVLAETARHRADQAS